MASESTAEQWQLVDFKLVYNILKALSFVIAVRYIIKIYLVQHSINAAVKKLPTMKLKMYHFLGHLQYGIMVRLSPRSLPYHVYDFIAITGYSFLFAKFGISTMWQMYNPVTLITKADLVEILLNHNTELKKAWFYDFLHPWLGTGLLTSYDEKWKNRRKLLTPAFHFNILKDFLPIANKQSKILVDILKNHTKDEFVDIVTFVTLCSLDIICESVLGKEVHAQIQPNSPYVKSIQALTSSTFERMFKPWLWTNFCLPFFPFGRKFIRDINVVHQFTKQLIAKQKAAKLAKIPATVKSLDGAEDENYKRKKRALLDLLLDEHINNNSISESDIREEVDTFTFEGHDTTSMGMSYALYLIGLHPWVQKKIHEELDSMFQDEEREATDEDLKNMKYLECVLKESLRLYPSVPMFGRELREDLNIKGYVIPKGTTCVVVNYLLHRDPDYFPNPEKFDPERFTMENSMGRHAFAYAPFSAGPRNCIGQRFALMEEKAVISTILRKYKVRSLDPRDKIHLVDDLVLRPHNGLRIQIRERNESFDFHSVYYRE